MHAVLIRVNTFMTTVVKNDRWKQAFNQVCFFNYDSNNPVTIGEFILPRATTDPVTGAVYPTFFEVSLNRFEVNDSYFDIKFVNGGTTNYLVIVHSLYNEGLTPATT